MEHMRCEPLYFRGFRSQQTSKNIYLKKKLREIVLTHLQNNNNKDSQHYYLNISNIKSYKFFLGGIMECRGSVRTLQVITYRMPKDARLSSTFRRSESSIIDERSKPNFQIISELIIMDLGYIIENILSNLS